MYAKAQSSKLGLLLGSFILIIGAYYFWWTNTVVAVLLLMGATFLIVSVICNCCAFNMSERIVNARLSYTPRGRSQGLGTRDRRTLDKILEVEPMDTSILPHDIPIHVLIGLSTTDVETLSRVGVFAISDLIYFGAESIVDVCDVKLSTAKFWVTDAKVIYEVAGLKTLEELASTDPEELFDTIRKNMDVELESIPPRYSISIEKTSQWIKRAQDLLS